MESPQGAEMNARQAILGSIRNALNRGALDATQRAALEARVPAHTRPAQDEDPVERFVRKFEGRAGTVARVESREHIVTAVEAYRSAHDLGKRAAVGGALRELKWPRVVGACCRNLFKRTAELSSIEDPSPEARKSLASEYNIWRITMMYSLIGSSVIIYGFQQPVMLVLIASAMTLLFSPVIFFYVFKFCTDVIQKTDKVYYPSALVRAATWITMILFTLATGLAMWSELGKFLK
jgi:hypothetical protein